MFDRRDVYLMKRTKTNEATVVDSKKMLNALKVEQRLHKIFGDSRFTMTRKIKYRQWNQHHFKIGIAKNTSRRKSQVTKNIFKSGKTEWFALNGLEYFLLRCWMNYYYIAWKVKLIFIITIIFFFITQN